VIEKLPAKYTINRRYQEGMASSFKAGLRELRGCDAVFLVLGDQPRVAHVFLRKAVKAWREGARIVSPVFKNRKGHPVLIDRSLFPEFLSLAKDGQIREVIEEHRDEHVLIKAGEWAVKDLDYPEDLAGLGKISKNPKTH
jgi:molybdenum cofactor cytidylyltransferase